jgi:arsenite/tail-anchored protein-transporting ATPase
MFTGKGGVGKTSLAAATGVKLAALNYRTLVMSIDPAHSLADSFDLDTDLFHLQTSDPLQVGERLWIQELNIQKEIKRHWQEISSYVTSVLRTTGISGVEAEELAILPGMEELSAMMYVNQYQREQRYDVIVLDAAPTAESMRFISMPTTLDWYMKHIFRKQDGAYEVRVLLPFATKGEIGLFKKGDELVVEIGTLRRHVGLPRSMAGLLPARARLENRVLTVEMKEAQ